MLILWGQSFEHLQIDLLKQCGLKHRETGYRVWKNSFHIHKGWRSNPASERPDDLGIDRPAATIDDFISMLWKEGARWHRQEEGGTVYLLSARSVLFPTNMMMTSLPLSVLTSSIHFVVCWKELTSERKDEAEARSGNEYSGDVKRLLWKRVRLWQKEEKEGRKEGD